MHTLTHAPYGRWRVLSLLSAYLNSWRVHGSVYMCSTSAGLKAMLYTFQHVLLSQLWGRLWESCLPTMVDQAIFYLKMRTISFSLYSQNPEIVLLSFMMLYKKKVYFSCSSNTTPYNKSEKNPKTDKKRDNDTKYSKNQAIGLVLEQLLKAVF